MTTPVPRSADRILGPGSAYGLGLISVGTDQWHVWGHDGSIPGYFSFSFTDEHGRRGVELFVPTEPTEELASAANDLLLAAVAASTPGPPPVRYGQ
jgi:hypothetical protein